MVEAIAYAGERPLTEAARPPAPSEAHGDLAILTRRETEVLRLIVDGKTDREIADTLSISSGTASRHVANILHKLEVRTRSAAAAWAIRNGLK
jgi:DNA-binding NarL/FixJ family response regulator